MCCFGFRSTQILIVKSRRAETETIEVHLRGDAATVRAQRRAVVVCMSMYEVQQILDATDTPATTTRW
jgi:hypothetical protein